jgi:ABC-2 type transport system ATP-binding protein
MDLAVMAEGLRKRFGRTRALDGVDLAVPPGTVCGLLGPNGAGKTTMVRILATLVPPDSGRATVAGVDVVADPQRARYRIGLAGQYAAVDELLTGRSNLVMFGRLYHLPPRAARRRANELLECFDLTESANRPVKTYSGGMRRRLDLAASLLVAPPVLFLDEPTTGLDPRSRLAVWEAIGKLVADGTTVLLTTQYLDEADRLADQIVVLNRAGSPRPGHPPSSRSRSAASGSTSWYGRPRTWPARSQR